jgi:hypothetical protein
MSIVCSIQYRDQSANWNSLDEAMSDQFRASFRVAYAVLLREPWISSISAKPK